MRSNRQAKRGNHKQPESLDHDHARALGRTPDREEAWCLAGREKRVAGTGEGKRSYFFEESGTLPRDCQCARARRKSGREEWQRRRRPRWRGRRRRDLGRRQDVVGVREEAVADDAVHSAFRPARRSHACFDRARVPAHEEHGLAPTSDQATAAYQWIRRRRGWELFGRRPNRSVRHAALAALTRARA